MYALILLQTIPIKVIYHNIKMNLSELFEKKKNWCLFFKDYMNFILKKKYRYLKLNNMMFLLGHLITLFFSGCNVLEKLLNLFKINSM